MSIYHLDRDPTHLVDRDKDAWTHFPNWQNFFGLILLKEYDLPDEIVFDAVFDVIGKRDYLINNIGWPIMSKRMLDTLLRVGDFPHRAVPIILCDHKRRSTVDNHDYVGVQLLEHLDIFDYENSDYDPHPRIAHKVKHIRRLAVTVPEEALPPLFRLKAHPSQLFVSRAAKVALFFNDIVGVRFHRTAGKLKFLERVATGNRPIANLYELSWDASHLEDLEEDAWINFPDSDKTIGLDSAHPYDLPTPLVFDCVFDMIEWLDYPINNLLWPIMSQKMVDALLNAGDFAHRAIPLTMRDAQIVQWNKGNPTFTGDKSDRFVAVQLLEHLDVMDKTHSLYDPHPNKEGWVSHIQELVLTCAPDELPPVFRLAACPTRLFVTEHAKQLLEAANVEGVVLRRNQVYSAETTHQGT